MNLRLHQVERAERGAGPGELAIGGRDHHVPERTHGASQNMQSDGVDSVVVGQENAHDSIVADGGLTNGIKTWMDP
jgi:hypothetical protein